MRKLNKLKQKDECCTVSAHTSFEYNMHHDNKLPEKGKLSVNAWIVSRTVCIKWLSNSLNILSNHVKLEMVLLLESQKSKQPQCVLIPFVKTFLQ